MKRLIPILAGVAVFLTIICVVQSKRLGKQESQVSSLNNELTEKSQRLDEIQRTNVVIAEPSVAQASPAEPPQTENAQPVKQRAQSVARQLPAVSAQAEPSAESASSGQEKDSKSSGEESAFAKMLSKMMQDPDTKKIIRDQQRLTMDQLYSPLVKQLGMNAEESDKFKDLIADQAMESSATLFASSSPSNRTEAVASATASQTTLDTKIKELLGEDRYAQYKDYQLTVGERMQLTQFKQMLGENPISDQQTEQLLAIMKEEKKNVAGPNGDAFSGLSGNGKAMLDALGSDDSMEKLLQAQNEVNERVYQRANEVLSPDQLTAFGKFQTNQTALMRMGVTMARKMFGSDKTGGGEK
jgi:hypothetical protein